MGFYLRRKGPWDFQDGGGFGRTDGVRGFDGNIKTPQLSLVACAVCGLSVGIMWPGTFSKASAALPKGGTAMFALLALGGDIGCSGGPTLVGVVSGAFGDDLKLGVLAGIIFPVLLLTGIILCRKSRVNVE